MSKILFFLTALLLLTHPLLAEPPKPNTFVPNRGIVPSQILAKNMKDNISGGIHDVIYVWNKTYAAPAKQIGDLMKIFSYLNESPKLPIQILQNEKFQLHKVLKPKKIIRALERFQKSSDKTYKSLLEYTNLILGKKDGDMDDAYENLLRDMQKMINSYNYLAEVTNGQYKKKIMPYYNLNQKKKQKSKGIFGW